MKNIYKPAVHEAYPDYEHGHMFPSKIKGELVYDDKFEYRVKSPWRKFLRFWVEGIVGVLGPIVCFFAFQPKVKNKKVFKNHKEEIKNGMMTISNHVLPLDNILLRTLRPFKRVEMPIWKEGAESTAGGMYRLAGGIPVPFSMRGIHHCFSAMNDVIKEKGWLHVYPEAACWEYYCPIREYKEGTFKIAVEHKVPVFPIAYSYRKPKGLCRIWMGKRPAINVSIGEPLYANEKLSPKEACIDLRDRVHLACVLLAGFSSEEDNENFKKTYNYYPYSNPYTPQYEKLALKKKRRKTQ